MMSTVSDLFMSSYSFVGQFNCRILYAESVLSRGIDVVTATVWIHAFSYFMGNFWHIINWTDLDDLCRQCRGNIAVLFLLHIFPKKCNSSFLFGVGVMAFSNSGYSPKRKSILLLWLEIHSPHMPFSTWHSPGFIRSVLCHSAISK